MKVRPLVLDLEAQGQIKNVKEYAEAHRINIHDLMATVGGRLPPVGDDPKRICNFFHGYRVVYSIEQQPGPLDWCHHLSVSVDVPPNSKLGPSVESVMEIARAFGFNARPGPGVHMFMETIDGNPVPNIVAKI